jgi:hypothetical protein
MAHGTTRASDFIFLFFFLHFLNPDEIGWFRGMRIANVGDG